MSLRRNHPDRRAAADNLVRQQLQAIDKEGKVELLADIGVRLCSATAGDICTMSIPYLGDNAHIRFDRFWGDERKKAVLLEALAYMFDDEAAIDQLLLDSARRANANGGAILQKASDCRIARDQARQQAGDEVENEGEDEAEEEEGVKQEEEDDE
jgi:hypothetical protein